MVVKFQDFTWWRISTATVAVMLFLFISHVAIDVRLRSYTVFAGIHVIIGRIWMLPVRHWCLHCTLGEGRMAIAPSDQSRRDEHTQWFSCNSRYSIPIWSISILGFIPLLVESLNTASLLHSSGMQKLQPTRKLTSSKSQSVKLRLGAPDLSQRFENLCTL